VILNLTQHYATDEQKAQLVVEPRMCKAKIQKLLTFEEIPQPDGSVRKIAVFRHLGFVEV
jgi:hypothetical protein